MAKRKARRTPKPRKRAHRSAERTVGLAEYARHTGATLDSLMRSVATISDGLQTLNGSIKVIDVGAREVSMLLVSQVAALRDLLIKKGVITAEEAIAVAQIAELERMLNAQSKIAKGGKAPRRRPPPPDAQGGT